MAISFSVPRAGIGGIMDLIFDLSEGRGNLIYKKTDVSIMTEGKVWTDTIIRVVPDCTGNCHSIINHECVMIMHR